VETRLETRGCFLGVSHFHVFGNEIGNNLERALVSRFQGIGRKRETKPEKGAPDHSAEMEMI
jgi:hypothetical protein